MKIDLNELNLDPKDLAEIEKMLETYGQYLPIIKAILEKTLPDLLDALSPIAKEFTEGYAKIQWHQYETLKELGFSETQAFDLLLNWGTRMERASRQTRDSVSAIKLNTDDKKGFWSRFSSISK